MNKKKNEIIKELKSLIKNNNFIKDIWLYGNFKDQVSDLDILILYKKKIEKILLPKIIKDLILDGTIVYIPYIRRYDIFLFEDLKIFSIKSDKKIQFKLSISNMKFQLLSSFIERYYERRQNLTSFKTKNVNDIVIRNIKSLIFSYETFYKYLSLKNTKFVKKNLFIKYNAIRKKYLQNKLTKKAFDSYLIELKKFDMKFNLFSFKILEKEFSKTKFKNFSYLFLKKYTFSDNPKYYYEKVPKIFGMIYFFYASLNLSLSKKIKRDFMYEKKIFFKNKSLSNFLYKKITFVNTAYLDLKKGRFKKGMYRFSWYLK